MKKVTNKTKDIQLLVYSLQYLYPYKMKFVLALLCIVSNIGFGLIGPLLWGEVLQQLFDKNWNGCITYIGWSAMLEVTSVCIYYAQAYLFAFLNQNLIFDLKKDIYSAMMKLPVKAFDEIENGEFMSRLHGDAGCVAQAITGTLTSTIVDVFRVIGIGIATFLISYRLALIILFCFPIIYFISAKYGKKLRKANEDIVKKNDNFYSVSCEGIWGIREIKVFGIIKDMVHKFLDAAQVLKKNEIKLTLTNAMSELLCGIVILLSRIGIMILGARFVIKGTMTIPHYVAFISYSNQFANALLGISRVNINLQEVMTALTRIYSMINGMSYTKVKFGEGELENIKGNITFHDVSFSYDEGKNVLKNLSLNIPAGKKTSFVGSSGCGKTTIFNLILKLYDPERGFVQLDGHNLDELKEKELRKAISIVRQDPFLFSMSIRDNLLLVNPSATKEEIEDACKRAYLDDFIDSLPEKYDTMLGENGITLSGGQRQRLAIARVLLKKSKIILFDEATSALDNESQLYINRAMEDISKECTVVTIAHRLSTIINSDLIYVIDDGKVVGSGKHGDLITGNSIYQRLYKAEVEMIHENF